METWTFHNIMAAKNSRTSNFGSDRIRIHSTSAIGTYLGQIFFNLAPVLAAGVGSLHAACTFTPTLQSGHETEINVELTICTFTGKAGRYLNFNLCNRF